jgi:hypothetical protein
MLKCTPGAHAAEDEPAPDATARKFRVLSFQRAVAALEKAEQPVRSTEDARQVRRLLPHTRPRD